jgi:hypothetical protein
MSKPGKRYQELAVRCRQLAMQSETTNTRAGLLRMADAYERRAAELNAPAEPQTAAWNAGNGLIEQTQV